MEERLGILDFDFLTSDLIEITVKNIRGDTCLENKLVVNRENQEKVNTSFSLIKKEGMGRCGYDYLIEVLKNGKKEKEVLICFSCNRLLYNSKAYYLDRANFEEILAFNGFEKFNVKTYRFKTLEEGREFWDNELSLNKVDLEKTNKPNWLVFDGNFVSSIESTNNQTAKEYLYEIFGNDDFEVTDIGFGLGYMIVTKKENCERYEKYKGEKLDTWNGFKNVELKIVYK